MTGTTLKDQLMSDLPFRYEYDEQIGDYVFKQGNRVLFRATSVAICYSEDTQIFGQPGLPSYTLHKHGITEDVLQHAHRIREAYKKNGQSTMASNVVVIMSDLWNIEVLNKILSTAGYLATFLEAQQSSTPSTHAGSALSQKNTDL